jgi:hypothetical protein
MKLIVDEDNQADEISILAVFGGGSSYCGLTKKPRARNHCIVAECLHIDRIGV